jgi:hypothetical protein
MGGVSQDYKTEYYVSAIKKKPSKGIGLLSKAYRAQLAKPVSEDLKQRMSLEAGDTYAVAIAKQVVDRAIGRVKDDEICFVAIKELRETTEGKTAEKVIAAGSNVELMELAKIMGGEPAPPDDDLEGDEETEEVEADFHGAAPGTEE